MSKGKPGPVRSEVLQGTLDLMILKALDAIGPLHGYGIARRIEQVSEDVLKLNEGTVYTALLRLEHQGWISTEWGASENHRRARFLFDYAHRPQTAHARDRELGAHLRSHRTNPAPRPGEVTAHVLAPRSCRKIPPPQRE
jgi:hypothetical protein